MKFFPSIHIILQCPFITHLKIAPIIYISYKSKFKELKAEYWDYHPLQTETVPFFQLFFDPLNQQDYLCQTSIIQPRFIALP